MSRATKAQQAERAEALERLRGWIKPGDTVYTVLDSVSRSGMSRTIRVLVPYTREDGSIDFIHPNHAVATALEYRQAKRGDGLIVGGCGMDMGFSLVYNLSHALYGAELHRDIYLAEAKTLNKGGKGPLLTRDGAPEGYVYVGGYQCLGPGKCPSNYHVNHRERVRCEGFEGERCYAPSRWGGRDIPEGWPLRKIEVDGETYDAGALACIGDADNVAALQVCPTCNGTGDVPNPEGVERWDLVHPDGYAVRHRWL